MPPLCLIETWNKHRQHACEARGSASAYHALSSSLQTTQAYARDHWAIVRYVCSHRSPVRLVANDAGSGFLGRHDDVHIAALNVFSYQVLSLLEDAVRMYYQRRRLGADGSGGMLAGAQQGQRTAPPTASDWGDAQCVRLQREAASGRATSSGGQRALKSSKVESRFQFTRQIRLNDECLCKYFLDVTI